MILQVVDMISCAQNKNNEKIIKLFTLFLISVFLSSCGQTKTNAPKENIKAETKDIVTSPGSNERNVHTTYEYADPIGKRLIIQNSFPKSGINYTDPNGKKYVYAVFWTQIINETFDPLELTIDFPLDSFEIPSSSGNYMKLILPSDTMTIDKEPLYDYGLTIKSFLDNNRHQSSSLKRTIHPKGSSTFYVVTLSNRGVGGILRTGLSLKEQNLFYRVNDKEIHCGKINLKNLRL
jgi:hypothetical protein